MNVPSGQEAHQQDETGPMIGEIMALLSQVSRRFEAGDSEQRLWLIEHCRNPAIIEILLDSTLLTLRVVDAIGRLELVNGITISRQFGIPKGSVSKVARRLVAQRLVEKEFLPHNKKEVLYRLSPLGRELFEVHQAFDQQMAQNFTQFLQQYDATELHFIVRVLQDLAESSWLASRPNP